MKLEVKNIRKSFEDILVLDGVSFTAESGKALGFLGRNGAGKTTTLRIILDVFKKDGGELLIDGEKLQRKKIRIGYLPEERGLYQDERLLRQLVYFARLKGAKKEEAIEDVEYWLTRFDLLDHREDYLSTLSKGNRQKAQIIVALLNDPDILILDEPFTGLDPINSQIMRSVIQEYIDKDRILILSSHQMNYIEEFCQEIAIIDHGKILLQGNINVIRSNLSTNRLVLNSKNLGLWQLKTLLENKGYIEEEADISDFKLLVQLKDGVDKDQVLNFLLDKQVDISHFALYQPGLQDIFVQTVGDIHE